MNYQYFHIVVAFILTVTTWAPAAGEEKSNLDQIEEKCQGKSKGVVKSILGPPTDVLDVRREFWQYEPEGGFTDNITGKTYYALQIYFHNGKAHWLKWFDKRPDQDRREPNGEKEKNRVVAVPRRDRAADRALVQSTPVLIVHLATDSAAENDGTVRGIVSRGGETVGDLVVTLISNDTALGTVPATVTIPDGVGAVPFTLRVVDDAVVEDDQNVIITARATGYIAGSDSLLVKNDDFPPMPITDNGDAGFSQTARFRAKP